jgi:hypothetical protein
MKRTLQLIISFMLVGISSCIEQGNDVSPSKLDGEITFRGEITLQDVTDIHTDFCELVCDSISVWESTSSLTSAKYPVVWSMITNGMAGILDVSVGTVISSLSSMGITSTNFTTVTEEESLPSPALQNALEALDETVDENWEEEDEDFMEIIVTEMETWKLTMDDDVVDAMIAVANSTYPYWRNNQEACLEDPPPPALARDRKKEGRALAWADLWGAATGALFGGPAGALLGAVGGTLGETIYIAVDP